MSNTPSDVNTTPDGLSTEPAGMVVADVSAPIEEVRDTLKTVMDTETLELFEVPDDMKEDMKNPGIYIQERGVGFSIFRLIDGEFRKLIPKNYYQRPEFNRAGIATISDESGTTFIKTVGESVRDFHTPYKISRAEQKEWFAESNLFVMEEQDRSVLIHLSDHGISPKTDHPFRSIHALDAPGYLRLLGNRSALARITKDTVDITPLKAGGVKKKRDPSTMYYRGEKKYKLGLLGKFKRIEDFFASGNFTSIALNDIKLIENHQETKLIEREEALLLQHHED